MGNEFDFERLKKEQENNETLGIVGTAIDGLNQDMGYVPTAHELLFGGKSIKQDKRPTIASQFKGMDDPATRQAKLFQAYKGAKEVEGFKKQDAEEAQMKDPNSQRSKAFKAFAQKRGIEIGDDASAYDVMQIMDPKKITESEADTQRQRAINQESNSFKAKESQLDRQSAYQLKNMEEQQKLALKKSPEEKLRSLSGTDKARYDNVLMVLKGLDDMGAALDAGKNTFMPIGDNDYTAAERRATEGYGRMQSGGAINTGEEKKFGATLPGMRDVKEMQRKKILDQRGEMLSRLKTLGFTPEEANYQPKEFKYGKTEATEPQFEADVIEYAAKHGMSPQTAQSIKEQRSSKRAGL
jgi:hypothetical protein